MLKRFFTYNNYQKDSDYFIKFTNLTNNDNNTQRIIVYEYGDPVNDFDVRFYVNIYFQNLIH